MSSAFLVVGAGPTGLGCATTLAAHGPTVIVERIPVAGGSAGWDRPDIRSFTLEAERAGVQFRLGRTALRWEESALLVTGPGSVDLIRGRHLFVAGGLRPATAANLGLVGERPAGVLPATVAEHLLQARVRLWHRVAIIGDGPWAGHVARLCRDLGTKVTAVQLAGSTARSPRWADAVVTEATGFCVTGRDRVSGLGVLTPSGPLELSCDAVVLAADPRPNRNIEGALLEGAPCVTYIQPTEPLSPAERHAAARGEAKAWVETNGDT